MKTVGLAVVLMLAVIAGSLFMNATVEGHLEEILDLLDEGEWLAGEKKLTEARESVLEALNIWEEHMWLFAADFPTAEIEVVNAGLERIREELSCGAYEDYKADNAALTAHLSGLKKNHRPIWENIF